MQTHTEGLSSQEAKERLLQYGPNSFTTKQDNSFLLSLLSKFKNPLIIILLIASGIAAATGQLPDFIIISTIVFFSVFIDSLQEYRSQRAVEKLKSRVRILATVIRDGEKKEVPLAHLTVGDLVVLSLGDIVPADATLVEVNDLHIDESAITGESFPQEKHEGSKIFMGSTVANGEAKAVVTAVGELTQYGKITHTLATQKPPTNFQIGMHAFGVLVSKLALILIVFIFSSNILLHRNLLESAIFALALAVGLTPELLPMIVTVNLVQGALRMAKKGVIVKRLPAIQNFGAMNVLCTDKTGTITENKIILERYENIHGTDDNRVLHYAFLNSVFQSNMRSPLDEAVLAHTEVNGKGYKKIDEIPFDFNRKRLSVIVKDNTEKILICKGAFHELLSLSKFYDDGNVKKILSAKIKEHIRERFEKLSGEGFRVLAVAYKHINTKEVVFKPADEQDLVLLGLIAFFDPPRADVREVLKQLSAKGIALKIITGDNELVTKKVCQELDLPVTGIVLGRDLAHHNQAEVQQLILKSNIFAQVNPDQKKFIIETLKKEGLVVGFMGDGVNDASSLKVADVGISVHNGVDVAKEAADIILLTKSLKILLEGVSEGRRAFANTMKYMMVGMGSNFGNMLSVSIASLVLPFLPILPIQILLNNLLYDCSQLTIPFDHVDEEFINKPLRWDIGSVKRSMFMFGPISSFFDFVTFAFLLLVVHASIPVFRSGWFIESLVTQCLIILSLRTKKTPFFTSKPGILLVLAAVGTPLLAMAGMYSPIGRFFELTSVPFVFWEYLLGVVICYFIVVEIVKRFFYQQGKW